MNEQDVSTQILSDITVYMKYARYLPEKKRRETWDELVARNMEMHMKTFTPGRNPLLLDEIITDFPQIIPQESHAAAPCPHRRI